MADAKRWEAAHSFLVDKLSFARKPVDKIIRTLLHLYQTDDPDVDPGARWDLIEDDNYQCVMERLFDVQTEEQTANEKNKPLAEVPAIEIPVWGAVRRSSRNRERSSLPASAALSALADRSDKKRENHGLRASSTLAPPLKKARSDGQDLHLNSCQDRPAPASLSTDNMDYTNTRERLQVAQGGRKRSDSHDQAASSSAESCQPQSVPTLMVTSPTTNADGNGIPPSCTPPRSREKVRFILPKRDQSSTKQPISASPDVRPKPLRSAMKDARAGPPKVTVGSPGPSACPPRGSPPSTSSPCAEKIKPSSNNTPALVPIIVRSDSLHVQQPIDNGCTLKRMLPQTGADTPREKKDPIENGENSAAMAVNKKLDYMRGIKEPEKVVFFDGIPTSTKNTEAILTMLVKSTLETFEFAPAGSDSIHELTFPAATDRCASTRFLSEAVADIFYDICLLPQFKPRVNGQPLNIKRIGQVDSSDSPTIENLHASARGQSFVPGSVVQVGNLPPKWREEKALKSFFADVLGSSFLHPTDTEAVPTVFTSPDFPTAFLLLPSRLMADVLFYRCTDDPNLLQHLGESVLLCRHKKFIPTLAFSQAMWGVVRQAKRYEQQQTLQVKYLPAFPYNYCPDKVRELFEKFVEKVKQAGLDKAAVDNVIWTWGEDNATLLLDSEITANAVMDLYIDSPENFVLEGGPSFLLCRHSQYVRPGTMYKPTLEIHEANMVSHSLGMGLEHEHEDVTKRIANHGKDKGPLGGLNTLSAGVRVHGLKVGLPSHTIHGALNEVFERELAGSSVLVAGSQVITQVVLNERTEEAYLNLISTEAARHLLGGQGPLKLAGITLVITPLPESEGQGTTRKLFTLEEPIQDKIKGGLVHHQALFPWKPHQGGEVRPRPLDYSPNETTFPPADSRQCGAFPRPKIASHVEEYQTPPKQPLHSGYSICTSPGHSGMHEQQPLYPQAGDLHPSLLPPSHCPPWQLRPRLSLEGPRSSHGFQLQGGPSVYQQGSHHHPDVRPLNSRQPLQIDGERLWCPPGCEETHTEQWCQRGDIPGSWFMPSAYDCPSWRSNPPPSRRETEIVHLHHRPQPNPSHCPPAPRHPITPLNFQSPQGPRDCAPASMHGSLPINIQPPQGWRRPVPLSCQPSQGPGDFPRQALHEFLPLNSQPPQAPNDCPPSPKHQQFSLNSQPPQRPDEPAKPRQDPQERDPRRRPPTECSAELGVTVSRQGRSGRSEEDSLREADLEVKKRREATARETCKSEGESSRKADLEVRKLREEADGGSRKSVEDCSKEVDLEVKKRRREAWKRLKACGLM